MKNINRPLICAVMSASTFDEVDAIIADNIEDIEKDFPIQKFIAHAYDRIRRIESEKAKSWNLNLN